MLIVSMLYPTASARPAPVRVLALLVAACALGAPAAAGGPIKYPSFRQCDERWGNDTMGTKGQGEQASICREGCALTSLSMVMASLGAVIYEDVADPGSLNSYFQRHGCYYCAAGDCNNLRLDCWALLDLTDRLQFEGEIQAPPRQELVANVTQGISAVIAHVHHSGHFVLLVDWDPASDSFEVHDPFYNSTHYPYANISDVIVYRYTTPVRSPVVPHKYPAFKQCSQPWAEDVMENSTVCREGCLMSSTAMSLARNGIHPDGHPADPGTLNQWLRRNGGYVNGTNDLNETAVTALDPGHVSWRDAWSMHRTNDLSLDYIQARLREGQPAIANVFRGGHFVLVVGWDASNPDTLVVHDPGFSRSTWSYSQGVVGWRLYNVSMEARQLRW